MKVQASGWRFAKGLSNRMAVRSISIRSQSGERLFILLCQRPKKAGLFFSEGFAAIAAKSKSVLDHRLMFGGIAVGKC
jgi:hypothetical protein